jgi:glycosyltransferase involved in cell wall biosynthesis
MSTGAGGPTIGVFVVCYNQARFVTETLDSMLAQTRPPDRVICVDDHSTDRSREVISRWLEEHGLTGHWETMFNPRNIGLCPSINAAVRRLGDVEQVAMVAGDDRWLPDKLERQSAQLAALPEDVGAVYSDALMIDESGSPLPGRFIATRRPGPPPEGRIFEVLLEGNFIPAPGVMLRRSAIEATGPWDEGLPWEDWDYWLRLTRRYRFAYTPEPTVEYRVVGSSMVGGLAKEARLRAHAVMFAKHLGASPETDRRIVPMVRAWVDELYRRGVSDRRAYLAGLRTRPRLRRRLAWGLAMAGIKRRVLRGEIGEPPV